MSRLAQYSRRQGRAWFAQLGALVLALAVASILELPLAATSTAAADPPPQPSELVGQRTASSRTFDNHDGTYTTSLYSGPVHYRGAQGAWRPISSAVVPTTESGYGLENEANRFRTLFKSTLANDFLALETGGGRFRLTLQNASQVAAQTAPRRVTYPGVFSGVDLRYDLRPDGVKETLLLQNAQAPTSYRFLLTPPANARIHAARGADGSWAFYMAPHARPVFVIDAPWAAEDDEPDSRRNHASLAVTRVGDVFALDLSVDGSWLRAAGRQFPVRLDPTITIQPTIQDASFNFACSGCAGIASDRLSIGTGSIGLSLNTWRSALQFSLADIPAGASVTSAQLKLFFDGTCVTAPGPACGGTSHQIDVLRMTNSWLPSSKTSELNTVPIVPNPSFTLPAGAPAQWMNWDITGTVQNWASGTSSNFGLLLKRATEPANASGPKPPSRNYAAEPTLGPTLQVTYNGDGGELLEPETVHSNGAELRWIPYGGPGAPPFDRYEVHRSSSPAFAPSDATRLTTIRDSAIDSFRDTTAKAGATFTYKVVVSGYETNARTVTMPADGQARKLLRVDAGKSLDTFITQRSDSVDCVNRGAEERLKVGTDAVSIWRSLLRFNLGDITRDATVSDASLSLWHPDVPSVGLTVRAHRMTANWHEGSGVDKCTGDGATWYESDVALRWAQDGGDYNASVSAALTIPAGTQAGWSQWSLTSLVQQWTNATSPNLGLVLKLDDETRIAGKSVDFYSSEFAVAPTLRPKFSVTYSDGSHAISPTVSVSKPSADDLVNGASVQIAATAYDDRRVDSVQFFVDGNSIGTDSSGPFSATWNSTTVGNGSHNLTARATDDAGNQTTSAARTITVGNSAAPTTSITSPNPPPPPAPPTTVTGTVPVTANANDDFAVTKVEFYADGRLLATDTTSPYNASWNTLDPAFPAYDGSHTLTTKAYDAHKQVTTSAPVSVTVNNAGASWYHATITTTTVFPPQMNYVPGAPSQQQYPFAVTVTNTNTGGPAFPRQTVVLKYRWVALDGSVVATGPPVSFPLDLQPLQAQTVDVLVEPPNLPAGLARTDYRLRFDLHDGGNPTNPWFADHGNAPLEGIVGDGILTEEEALGVESYFRYESEQVGAGMESLVNVATGNLVVRWAPFHAPGIGLSTDLELTYNSRETGNPPSCGGNSHAHCPLGPGWSLAVSSLSRFGHQQFYRRGNSDVFLNDADGTTYHFTKNGARWDPPAGIHLYLRQLTTTVCTSQQTDWALTRPDRTTYFYATPGNGQHGWPVAVRDKNGNTLCFTRSAPDDIVRVTDVAGRYFDLVYAANILQSITDHTNHKLVFSYTDHRLSKIVEVGGTNEECLNPDNRCFEFAYTGGRLTGVTDPRRNSTSFQYDSLARVQSRTNRMGAGHTTTFEYFDHQAPCLTTSCTRVTKPLNRVTRYDYGADRLVTKIVNPLGEESTIEWWPSRHVKRVTEPPPRRGYTQYSYDQNGLVTLEGTLTDAEGSGEADDVVSRTAYEYDHFKVDNDPNDTNESISRLKTRTDPNGVATQTPNDYRWQYFYDNNTNDNLTQVVDPTGAQTWHTYNGNGTPASTKDALLHETTFEEYDTNGFPQLVRQRMKIADLNDDLITRYDYDENGLLLWQQDPRHENAICGDLRDCKTVYDYDPLQRVTEQSSPKSISQLAAIYIWTKTTYDLNNNILIQRQPSYAHGGGPATTFTYNAMDQQLTAVDPVGAQTNSEYDLADRLEKTTLPRGVGSADPTDFVTQNVYDALDRIITEIRYPCQPRPDCTNQGESVRKTHSCYQIGSGDLLWVIAPNALLPAPPAPPNTCNDPNPQPPSHTTRYSYDDGHRQLTETTQETTSGPLRVSSQSYDANGNVIQETDEDGTRTDSEYSQRDELLKTIETFQKDINDIPTRILTTAYVYDLAGNLIREVSPRAWDACTGQPGGCDPGVNGDYVAEYWYDEADRQTRVDLPKKGVIDPRTYVHNSYDKNGNLTMNSLPVVNQNVADVPLHKQTTFTYWDPGWIQSSWDHVDNPVSFDYSAAGWQTSRISDRRNGSEMTWEYWPDGMLHRTVDRGGQDAVYTYDLDKNIIEASENRGQGQSPQAYKVQGEYNGFDEPSKTREVAEGQPNWTFTAYRYDPNGNVARREDDGLEQTDHTLVQHGRLNLFAYNWVDEQTRQDELGTDWQDPDPLPNTGDLRVDRTFLETGWPKTQILHRYSGSWVPRVNTTWTYFANGDLESLTAKDYQVPVHTLEQHTLGYEQNVNGRMVYLNGNRTTDSFTLRGPPPPGQPTACETTCLTKYKYGVRENLTGETRTRGANTTATCYALDPAMNVTDEWELNQACPDEGSPTGNPRRHFEYPLGTRLTKMQDNAAGVIRKYFHDDDGNLTCVTRTDASTASDCPDPVGSSVSANLEERFGWHYQNRLHTYHKYGLGAGTATYFHDPFDRLVRETETHEGQPDRETTFTYQGLSNLETREAAGPQTKGYVYDAEGQLVAMTQGTGTPPVAEFGYSMNVHGDPSLLVDLVSDEVHATYGYKAYGSNDAGLNRIDTDPLYPTNPYRFNAKRYDPGSTTLAMGARRYNTDVGRFVQQDFLIDSSEDVTLALDAPTQNRYVFGAGNPVELMETDGHTFTRRRDPWPRLWTKKMIWNARFIYSVARRTFLPSGRVLSPGRARELVGASNAESTLGRHPVNSDTGAIGLFHLLGPYQTRGKSMLDGDLMRPWVNTCAIMPNFVAFWDIYPNAAPALGATTVESSESRLAYYRGKLREIPPASLFESQRFGPPPKPGVTRCMYRGRTVPAKPICAPYFGGTKYAGPPNRCSEDGTDLQPWSRN